MRRILGRSGIEVSGLGMGCWGLSGVYHNDSGGTSGWGDVDDAESVRTINRAMDLGVTLFDTADVYGTGRSELVVGRALEGIRDTVIIATKFGRMFDENTSTITGSDPRPEHVREACEASLRRLRTDYIDLYQWHIGDAEMDHAEGTREELEKLVAEGKIRWYGWSTDDADRARFFADGEHCATIQQHFNVFGGQDDTLGVCEEHRLASLNRGPLSQGILIGKFSRDSKPVPNTVRESWNFEDGTQARQLDKFEAIRSVLTSGGRTPGQGALAWLWARSGNTIPIPGAKTVKQIEENAGAMQYGPLSDDEMRTIDTTLRALPD
jgi:aryl-alcohol dehydrogenase-like predicted oxidoreductase